MRRRCRALGAISTSDAAALCRQPALTNQPAVRLHLLQVPLDDGNDFVDSICFSYDGSQGSDFYDVRDLQDPFYTLLRGGGIQDSRVGRAGQGGAGALVCTARLCSTTCRCIEAAAEQAVGQDNQPAPWPLRCCPICMQARCNAAQVPTQPEPL